MRRAIVMAAFAALVLVFTPAPASSQDTGLVTIVHAATFDAESNLPVTVCVDGEVLIPVFNTTDIEGPVELPAGEYDVTIFNPTQADCAGEPVISGTLQVAAGSDSTAMAYWGPEGPDLAQLTNDTTCVDPGNGRVTARHAAAAGPVDVVVDGTPVLSGLAPGAQASVDVPAGDYSGVQVVAAGTEDVVLDIGTITVTESNNLIAYVYGGADGAVGVFTDEVEVCEEAVATTSTTSTTAPATAAAAATRPTFTG